MNAPSYQKEYFQKGIGALLCDCPRSQSRPSFLNFLSFGLTSEGLNFDVLWGPMRPSKNIAFFWIIILRAVLLPSLAPSKNIVPFSWNFKLYIQTNITPLSWNIWFCEAALFLLWEILGAFPTTYWFLGTVIFGAPLLHISKPSKEYTSSFSGTRILKAMLFQVWKASQKYSSFFSGTIIFERAFFARFRLFGTLPKI